eukprot:scpid28595/ scgid25371/ 
MFLDETAAHQLGKSIGQLLDSTGSLAGNHVKNLDFDTVLCHLPGYTAAHWPSADHSGMDHGGSYRSLSKLIGMRGCPACSVQRCNPAAALRAMKCEISAKLTLSTT